LIFDTGADNLLLDTLFYKNNDFKYQKVALGHLPGVGTKAQKAKIILDSINFQFGNYNFKPPMVPFFSLKTIV